MNKINTILTCVALTLVITSFFWGIYLSILAENFNPIKVECYDAHGNEIEDLECIQDYPGIEYFAPPLITFFLGVAMLLFSLFREDLWK